jgi:hypothetical protein
MRTLFFALLVTTAACSAPMTTDAGTGGGTGGGGGAASDAGLDAGAGGTGGGGAGSGPCSGADFVSCNDIQPDGTGECTEASGFSGTQRQVFEATCTGTLGTTPCPRGEPNVGGCKQPASFCDVIWGYQPNDPTTSENEYLDGITAQQQGCALIGTYVQP